MLLFREGKGYRFFFKDGFIYTGLVLAESDNHFVIRDRNGLERGFSKSELKDWKAVSEGGDFNESVRD